MSRNPKVENLDVAFRNSMAIHCAERFNRWQRDPSSRSEAHYVKLKEYFYKTFGAEWEVFVNDEQQRGRGFSL